MTRPRSSTWSSTSAIGPLLRCAVILRGAERHADGTFTLRCAYCACSLARDDVTIDHIVPRSEGGTNARTNLVPACVDCNVPCRGPVPRHVRAQARRRITPELRAAARALALEWYPWLGPVWERNKMRQRLRDARKREKRVREHVHDLNKRRARTRKEDRAWRAARDDYRRAAA